MYLPTGTNQRSIAGVRVPPPTAGTEEYGLIQKVTYSTNTTVNVQVPEGCAVPTTGGISNVYYSNNKSPYGFVTNAGRWEIIVLGRTSNIGAVNASQYYDMNRGTTIPIGDWLVSYKIALQNTRVSSRFGVAFVSLSTSKTSFTDDRFNVVTPE